MDIEGVWKAVAVLGLSDYVQVSITQGEVQRAVEKKVAQIAAMTQDCEAAHSEEDKLYTALLMLAAQGVDIKWAASVALKTQEMDFHRHCA